jgi:hypothetical protein
MALQSTFHRRFRPLFDDDGQVRAALYLICHEEHLHRERAWLLRSEFEANDKMGTDVPMFVANDLIKLLAR